MLFDLNKIPKDTKSLEVLHWERIKKIKATDVDPDLVERLQNFGWRMVATCLTEDGIGLAGPQVGLFKKAMLCREMTWNEEEQKYEFKSEFQLYINPTFEAVTEEGKWKLTEYCLSVPGRGYDISRWKKIEISWDELENGKFVRQSKTLDGWPARLFQHEFDHLNGISIPQRWELQNKPKNPNKKRKKRK